MFPNIEKNAIVWPFKESEIVAKNKKVLYKNDEDKVYDVPSERKVFIYQGILNRS